jgi:hypothetical protein
MLTAFQFCRRDDLDPSETKILVRELNSDPVIGQRFSLGKGERWEIVKLEPFAKDGDVIMVVYLNRIDLPLLPEQDWDCNRWDREFEFNGGSLSIIFWEDGRKTLMYLHGDEEPVTGEIVPSFKPSEEDPDLLLETAPYDTFVKIEKYEPKASSYYEALYLCWNQEVAIDC